MVTKSSTQTKGSTASAAASPVPQDSTKEPSWAAKTYNAAKEHIQRNKAKYGVAFGVGLGLLVKPTIDSAKALRQRSGAMVH